MTKVWDTAEQESLSRPLPRGAARRQRLRCVQDSAPPITHLQAEEGIAAGGVMAVNTALQEVLKAALIHKGLARGIPKPPKP